MRISHGILICLFTVSASSFHLDSYAALGDSYATGTGAGDALYWPPSNAQCARFAKAYPIQIADANKGVIFRNLACGAASTWTVRVSQVPSIDDSQVITLTIGGNEVDFFKVVNDCVYQWVTSDCNAALKHSRSAIESGSFPKSLEKLVKAIMGEKVPRARLLVTGYARFFNDTTTLCDHVSFSTSNPEEKMTRKRRADLNGLQDLMNSVIKRTVEDNGAEYVDVDALFEGHRFCEDGVMEPDEERNATWFRNLNSPRSKSEGSLAREQPWTGDMQPILTPRGIPDVTVFHPTIRGQSAIARAIMKQLDEGAP